jgi:phage terminase small subunit
MPTALQELRGNPGRRKANADEPRPAAASSWGCPVWLRRDRVARAFWDSYAPELARIGVLTIADLAKFEACAMAYSRWREYERLTSRVGLDLAIAKGYRNAALKERQQFAQLCASFGLDPSARSGVKAIAPKVQTVTEGFMASAPKLRAVK